MPESPTFPDRRPRLFGREPDITRLLDRTRRAGFTALAARAQMGKTWLVEEVGRRLVAEGVLVGYHECKGEPDMLLRAVSDVYERWLSGAGMLAQAASLWARHKSDATGLIGKAVGSLFEAVTKLGPTGADKVGSLVRDAFQGLTQANADLRTGGIQLKPLQYDQMRELLALVSALTEGRRIVLILDAWEKSPSAGVEHATLSAFLSRPEEWPPLHIIACARQPDADVPGRGDEVFRLARTLVGASPAAAVLELPPMHLGDEQERDRLVTHVRRTVRAAAGLSADDVLPLIDGFPGVVGRWCHDARREHMTQLQDLRREADDAQAYRYGEMGHVIRSLDDRHRALAIRLAVCPRLDGITWSALRELLLQDLDEQAVDLLVSRGALETGTADEPVTYGHDARHQAARRWLTREPGLRQTVARQTEDLMYRLASAAASATMRSPVAAGALAGMEPLRADVALSPGAVSLTLAATALFGIPVDPEQLLRGHRDAMARDPRLCSLFAMALYNTLNDARRRRSLDQHEKLLDALRDVHRVAGDHAAVRMSLAAGLVNSLELAKTSAPHTVDAVLAEVRSIHRAAPSDPEVAVQLALGLLSHALWAQQSGAPGEPVLALVDELRPLYRLAPADTAMCEAVAIALGRALQRPTITPAHQDRLLDELRQLHREAPTVEWFRAAFGVGLMHRLLRGVAPGTFEERQTLLNELRDLQRTDPELRAGFAALLDTMGEEARAAGVRGVPEAWLAELRELHDNAPSDAKIAAALARALLRTLAEAHADASLERRNGLLEDLRHLYRTRTDDPGVCGAFGQALVNMLAYVGGERPPEGRERLLGELWDFYRARPDDRASRRALARGLVNVLNDLTIDGSEHEEDRHLEQLGILYGADPQDHEIRLQMAMGWFNALFHARQIGAHDRGDRLLDNLRQLLPGGPDNDPVREYVADGLRMSLARACFDGRLDQCHPVLDELRALYRGHPRDGAVRQILIAALEQLAEDVLAGRLRNSLREEAAALRNTG